MKPRIILVCAYEIDTKGNRTELGRIKLFRTGVEDLGVETWDGAVMRRPTWVFQKNRNRILHRPKERESIWQVVAKFLLSMNYGTLEVEKGWHKRTNRKPADRK